MFKEYVKDKLEGVIQNPFAFYFPIQRGFSGSMLTLPFAQGLIALAITIL